MRLKTSLPFRWLTMQKEVGGFAAAGRVFRITGEGVKNVLIPGKRSMSALILPPGRRKMRLSLRKSGMPLDG